MEMATVGVYTLCYVAIERREVLAVKYT